MTESDNYSDVYSNPYTFAKYSLANGLVDPLLAKAINANLSLEAKLGLVEQNTNYKGREQAQGFQSGTITKVQDGDTVHMVDANGKPFWGRIVSDTYYDSVDKPNAILRSNHKLRNQPGFLGQLSPDTPFSNEEVFNASNYHTQETLKLVSNIKGNEVPFSKYDPNTIYGGKVSGLNIPAQYKVTGFDKNGRALIRLVNPSTGKDVGYEASHNPYLNADFNIYDALNTNKSKPTFKSLFDNDASVLESLNRIKEATDPDGRIFETADMMQSVLYQSFGRVWQHMASDEDKAYWQAVASPETGQALADAWAGVKTSTRKDYVKNLIEAKEDWDNGNYFSSTIKFMTQIDRVLGESVAAYAPVLAVSAAASAAGAPTLIAGALAAGTYAADATLSSMEDYKINNNGREMSNEKIAETAFLQFLTAIPDTFLVGAGLTKFLPKTIRRVFGKPSKATEAVLKPLEKTKFGTAKAVGFEAAGEMLQEPAQNTVEDWAGQSEENARSLFDIATDWNERTFDAMTGLTSAGTMSSLGAPLTYRSNKHQNENIDTINKIKETTATRTATGSEASTALSKKALDNASALASKIDYTNKDEVLKAYTAVKNKINDPRLNLHTQKELRIMSTKMLETCLNSLSDEKDREAFLKATGATKQQVFIDHILGSDADAQNTLLNTGKHLSKEEEKQREDDLVKFAETIGIPKEAALKTIKEVHQDIRYGTHESGLNGYYVYRDQLNYIKEQLSSPDLAPEEKTELEGKKEELLSSISYLLNSQIKKVETIANSVRHLTKSNNRENKYKYANGNPFVLRKNDLIKYQRGSGKGMSNVVDQVNTEISEMKDILKEYLSDEDIANRTRTDEEIVRVFESYDSAVNELRSLSTKAASVNMFNVPRHFEEIKGTHVNQLARLGSMNEDNKSYSYTISTLSNFSIEQLEAKKKDIENSSIDENKKKAIIAGIDKVIKFKKDIEQTTAKEKETNKKLIEEVSDFLEETTKAKIKNASKKELDKIINTLSSLHRQLINTGKESNSSYISKLDELAKEIVKKSAELLKEEQKKKAAKKQQEQKQEEEKENKATTEEEEETEKDEQEVFYDYPEDEGFYNPDEDSSTTDYPDIEDNIEEITTESSNQSTSDLSDEVIFIINDYKYGAEIPLVKFPKKDQQILRNLGLVEKKFLADEKDTIEIVDSTDGSLQKEFDIRSKKINEQNKHNQPTVYDNLIQRLKTFYLANQMENEGKSSQEIEIATGWIRLKNGKWSNSTPTLKKVNEKWSLTDIEKAIENLTDISEGDLRIIKRFAKKYEESTKTKVGSKDIPTAEEKNIESNQSEINTQVNPNLEKNPSTTEDKKITDRDEQTEKDRKYISYFFGKNDNSIADRDKKYHQKLFESKNLKDLLKGDVETEIQHSLPTFFDILHLFSTDFTSRLVASLVSDSTFAQIFKNSSEKDKLAIANYIKDSGLFSDNFAEDFCYVVCKIPYKPIKNYESNKVLKKFITYISEPPTKTETDYLNIISSLKEDFEVVKKVLLQQSLGASKEILDTILNHYMSLISAMSNINPFDDPEESLNAIITDYLGDLRSNIETEFFNLFTKLRNNFLLRRDLNGIKNQSEISIQSTASLKRNTSTIVKEKNTDFDESKVSTQVSNETKENSSTTKEKSINIGNITIKYLETEEDSNKPLAGTSFKTNITHVQKNLTTKKVIDYLLNTHATGVVKAVINDKAKVTEAINKEYGIDFIETLKQLSDEDILKFILLHEYRHTLQASKRNTPEQMKKDYMENPIIFEKDANVFALRTLGLLSNKKSKALGTKENPIQVYSDGSDIKGTGKIGYGAVFKYNGKEYGLSGTEQDSAIADLKKRFPNAKFSNPTMEMLALASILEVFAKIGTAEHIEINQDYKGAVNYSELWNHSEGSLQRGNKPWKAKEPYIEYLVNKAITAIQTIEANGGSVHISWVKGHQKTNDEVARMNDLADHYAKSRNIFNNVLDAYTEEKNIDSDKTDIDTQTSSNSKKSSSTTVENTEETHIVFPKFFGATKKTFGKAVTAFISTQQQKHPNSRVIGIIAYRLTGTTKLDAENKGVSVIGNPFNWTKQKLSRAEAEKKVTIEFEQWLKGDKNLAKQAGSSVNILKQIFVNRDKDILYYADDAPINHAKVIQDLQTFFIQKGYKEWSDTIINDVKNEFHSRFTAENTFIDESENYNYPIPDNTDNTDNNSVKTNNTTITSKDNLGAIPTLEIPSTVDIWYSRNDEYSKFSNLAERPFVYNGLKYKSVEHAYQTWKSGQLDVDTYNLYDMEKEPGKIRGKRGVDKTKNIKLMELFIRESFKQNPEIAEELINTGNTIFTHNNDTGIWRTKFPELLMKIRTELQQSQDSSIQITKSSDLLTKDNTKNSAESDRALYLLSNFNIIRDEKKVGEVHFNLKDEIEIDPKKASSTLATTGLNINSSYVQSILRYAESLRLKYEKLKVKDKNGEYKVKNVANAFLLGTQTVLDEEETKRTGKPTYVTVKDSKGKSILTPGGLLKQAPQLRLLYKIMMVYDKDFKNKVLKFEYKPITLVAVDLAIKELVSTDNLYEILAPNDMYKIARSFGLNEDSISLENLTQYKEFVSNYGIPKSVLASRIGTTVLQILGVTKAHTDNSTKGFYEKLATGLGLFALSYASNLGIIEETAYNPEKDTQFNSIIDHKLQTIKIVKTPEARNNLNRLRDNYLGPMENGKRVSEKGIKSIFKVENTYEKNPRTSPEGMSDISYLRHTDNLVETPEYSKATITKLAKTPYEINSELVDLIFTEEPDEKGNLHFKYLDSLKKYLGYIPEDSEEFANLSYDAKESAIGVNRAILKELDNLIKFKNIQDTKNKSFYFDWFVSKNGRAFIDSTTLNPQTNKFQRFLCLPKSVKHTFGYTKKEQKAEYFTIAQAFDSLNSEKDITALGKAMNKLSLADLRDLREGLLTDPKGILLDKRFSQLYKKTDGTVSGLEGIENLAQCLVVMQHLIRKKEANGAPFETWLTVENDSTTSGYFLRFLQFSTKSIIKKFGEKVGIFFKDVFERKTTIHELKSSSDFLDIYKTMAFDTSKYLPLDDKGNILDDAIYSMYYNVTNEDDNFIIDSLTHSFKLIVDALPKKTEEGKISKALRTLLKSPSMIFGYTAGKRSVAAEVSETLSTQFINTYVKIASKGKNVNLNDLTTEEKAIYNLFEYLNTLRSHPTNKNSIYTQLMEKPAKDIWLTVADPKNPKITKNITLIKYLTKVLGDTYGTAVWDSLSESFAEYSKYNDSLNYVTHAMFSAFDHLFKAQYSNLEKDLKNVLGVKEQDIANLYNELLSVMPRLPLIYSDNELQGMLLMRMEKSYDENSRVINPVFTEDGRIDQSDSAYARVLMPANPRKMGAVIPIHFIDGMIMMYILHTFEGITPVHDAMVMSAFEALKVTKEYNNYATILSKSFNLFEIMFEKLSSVLDKYDEKAKELNLPSSDKLIAKNGLDEELVIYKDENGNEQITSIKKLPPDTDASFLSLRRLQEYVNKQISVNNSDRAWFFNQDFYIGNVDGEEGSSSIYKHTSKTTASDIMYKQALKEEEEKGITTESQENISHIYHSDPDSYLFEDIKANIIQEATEDPEARIQVLESLQALTKELGGKVCSSEMMAYFKTLLQKIDLKGIKDALITYVSNQPYTAGMFVENTERIDRIVIGFEDKNASDIDKITGISPYTDMSPVEVYVHEVIHAALRYSETHKDDKKVKKIYDDLYKLMLKASEVLTWEDFMPSEYDPALKEVYEKQAKARYNYIFNNKSNDPNRGLHEFIAYTLTKETLINKLKNQELVSDIKSKVKIKFLDKLIRICKTLFDIVFGKSRLSDIINILNESNPTKPKQTIYNAVETLVTELAGANNKALAYLDDNKARVINIIFKLLGDIRLKGNQIISPRLHKLFNLADIHGKTFDWLINPTGNIFNDSLRVINMLALFLVSESRRKALKQWLVDVTHISQQNAIMCILRDLAEPDYQSSRLEALVALTKMVEQSSKGIEGITRNELLSAFDNKIKPEEAQALTEACLFTDLQSIYDEHNIDYVKKILSDSSFREEELESLDTQLKASPFYNYYKNQIEALADYMVTGRTNPALNLNATNIAKCLYTTHKIEDPSKDLIALIDKYATILAVEKNNQDANLIASKLSDKGLSRFLSVSKKFVQESYEGIEIHDTEGKLTKAKTINPIHIIKGYTKQLGDPSIEIKKDLLSNRKLLEKEGYTLAYKLKDNKITGSVGLAVYTRSFIKTARREGAGFIITGAHAMGTTLKNEAYFQGKLIDEFDEALPKRLHAQYIKNADKSRYELIKAMDSHVLTNKEWDKYTSGLVPIPNPWDGLPSDYHITMSNSDKIKYLHTDMNGINILSKTVASQNTRINSTMRNNVLIAFLEADMNNNMNKVTHRNSDGQKYVKITKNTTNTFLKEAIPVFPKELLNYIEKRELYVREDWLQDLFGIPNISLNDLSFLQKHRNRVVTYAISLTEYIVKTIAAFSKNRIVLLVPQVLRDNIISNINVSVMNGANPARVAHMQLENARALRTYLTDKKEMDTISFRERIGYATANESKRKIILQHKLENNIVHPLMIRGMYQSIVEDLNPDDMDTVGTISKVLKKSKFYNKLSEPIKWVSRQIYMTEGTPIYDFMFQATQYSDFVARATEYQLQMERAPQKIKQKTVNGVLLDYVTKEYQAYEEKVFFNIWNTFINYDKPQSSIEQYLNDMGLVMFTKFAKRIQHVITKSVFDNPMGVLWILLSHGLIMDTEDILEQNVFNKSWSSLFHNPIENFINVAVPMPVQYLTDMRTL